MEDPDDVSTRGRCSKFLHYSWKICTCLFSHVLLVSLVVAYCIMGAFTFQSLEVDNERKVKKNISNIRMNVTDFLWDLFQKTEVLKEDNWTDHVRNRLKMFEQDLLRSMKSDGWDGTEDENVVQWTFAGALFYSIIVITTIGYGHIAPKTQWGKVVTIFYAILGIPLMLLCLSNIGDIMAQSFRFLYWKVCCYVCTRRPKRGLSRRGRSIRNTVRQGGGRYSGRSRTSSFRRSGRTSQRSTDSALGLSECRSSYSDTDCRYIDDGDLTMMSNRASQHSRFSDTVLQVSSTITPPIEQGSDFLTNMDMPPAPVLTNKYAIEREERSTLPRRCNKNDTSSSQNQLSLDVPSTRDSLKDSLRSRGGGYSRYRGMDSLPHPHQPSPCRPRIMSPMGFAISRQQSQRQSKNSKLSRLREDDYDYELECYDYEYEDGTANRMKAVPIWLCVFLVVTYILCGAALFMQWERWEFLDSAYFCFITLTTIGFGDFVPAKRVQNMDGAEISIALCSLYLLFGIALLAMSFNLVQEEVINNVKTVAKRLGIVKDDEEEDD
ncbi:hypothetical protein L9F63_012251 [Diploptera punctata]|uniref:Potassium channel domain-containing protein n=1 Tax=Diploptera punctata TaxID=6984 RepID=A0AAD8ENI9_DIPPU|nr:hypothetical protein L9F63_012251 [Diploptera punctata]